jgi:SlyX protein
VVGGLGVEPARQQQRAGEGLRVVALAAGAFGFGMPEAAVEGGVVRHQRAAAREAHHLVHDRARRRCPGEHRVADAGELLDERRHPGAAVHQALEAADDLPALNQHRGDLGGARALRWREAGGLEVDDGDGFHAGGIVAAGMRSNTGMRPADDTDERLTALEIKASFTEDLVDQLNDVIVRQQQQLAALQRELEALRQRVLDSAPETFRSLRDELPPHY